MLFAQSDNSHEISCKMVKSAAKLVKTVEGNPDCKKDLFASKSAAAEAVGVNSSAVLR
jgi:hypothetical protein